jgi:SAM-dependent methyltransferase
MLGARDSVPGHGVQLALQDPYLPPEREPIDIVISRQMLEHCEFFWLALQEMVSTLRPGGFIFLIAPSSGAEHRYPVDCYRFYPNAYRALARYAALRRFAAASEPIPDVESGAP